MPEKMTKTAWDPGSRNGLLTSGIFFVMWLSTAGLIAAVKDSSFKEALNAAFALLWMLVLGWFFVTWVRDRMTGGYVLLDCGPHPGRILLRVLALIFLFVSLDYGQDLGEGVILFGVITAIYFMMVSLGRLQFRENGIFRYQDLLSWSRIEQYEWTDDSTLWITSRGMLGIVDFGALPVPPELKNAIDRLLQEKRGSIPAIREP